MLTQEPHTRSDVIEVPQRTEASSTRDWLMERIDVRIAIGVGVAWFVLTELAALLEPAPQESEPLIGVLLGVAIMAIALVMLVGLSLRRRWGALASLGGAVLATAATIACPVSGHHQFGTWWYGEMACMTVLLGVSVGALRSGPGVRQPVER